MLTISQFADRCGLSPSALRFYERKGLLLPTGRRANGYRAYAPGQVEEARSISSLRAAGIPIAAIREFLRLSGRAREAMLATWQQEMTARLLSLEIADQYLRGVSSSQLPMHLEHWKERSVLVWYPATAPEGPLAFRADVAARKRELARRRVPVLTSGYVRTLDLRDGELHGEVGFRIRPGRRLPPGARRQDVPPTVFATLECTARDEKAAHRVFRFLHGLGFRPGELHLERYLPGAPDRYLLMMAVRRIQPSGCGGERPR
ncbi:MerR family transcriptional regulator [Sorangium sp. So ce394]|uniref:MerR family transcriptional regulator n=1 Tax=Sorangium sp. So ce394 TaxID=3133310 RepID=UPI003F5AE084